MKKLKNILFSSLKGGVGKSTVAYNVAASLAEDGFKVVLADLDFRSRSLDLMLGVSDSVVLNICDLILDNCSADQLLIDVPVSRPGAEPASGKLLLCPACSEKVLTSEVPDLRAGLGKAFTKICEETNPDYVICDTGADSLIPSVTAEIFADMVIIVTEQSRTSVRAGEESALLLGKLGNVKQVRLAINNFDIDAARSGARAGILELIDNCAVRCIGVVPKDIYISEIQDMGLLPDVKSPVYRSCKNIAARIEGIETPLFTGMKKERKKAIL